MTDEVFRVGDSWSATVRVELFTTDVSPGVRRSLAGGFEVWPEKLAAVLNAAQIANEANRLLKHRGEDAVLEVKRARLVRSNLQKIGDGGDLMGYADVEMSGVVSDNLAPVLWAVMLIITAGAVGYAIGRAQGDTDLTVGEVVTTALSRVGSGIGAGLFEIAKPLLPIALVLVVVVVWLKRR